MTGLRGAELLAPAGDFEALKAAVQNGADAVYLGGSAFGARAQAAFFAEEALKEAVAYCHLRGARLYITLNTLVKDAEFEAFYAIAREAILAGVDAALVQDLGAISLLRESFPGLELHASTQMSINNASGARMAAELGLKRVVAARECSLDALAGMAQSGVEVEAFCHGALCAGFSGQCLLSSFIGGRSGNRGRCAQPCRHALTLDGRAGYHLSTRDLCSFASLSELLSAGVSAFKIEGRLKRPEYVAIVTAAYRRALDLALEGRQTPEEEALRTLSALQGVFNRGGFTEGYAGGSRDAAIYFAERPNHLGLPVGTVLRAEGGRALIAESAALHPGDGLEARIGSESVGLTVEGVDRGPFGAWIRAPKGLRAKMSLHRTSDALQLQAARQSYAGERRRHKIKIWFRCLAGEKTALRLDEIEVFGEAPREAVQHALREDQLRRQLEKLGDSIFEAGEVQIELGEGLFLPLSAINALRREAAAGLEAKILAQALPSQELLPYSPTKPAQIKETRPNAPLRVRRSGSIQELLSSEADELEYAPVDYTLPSLRAALLRLQGAVKGKVRLSLPPFLEEGELQGIAALLKETGTAAVANNLSQLYALRGTDLTAGFGLNVFNTRTALTLQGLGAARLRLSPECTLGMAAEIAKSVPAELFIQGRLPAMVLRSCPLRAREGLGGEGRERCMLCKREGFFLKDRKGASLPLLPYFTQKGCTIVAHNPFPLDIGSNGRERLKTMPFSAIIEETLPEGGQRTRGHFFRGVE